jgi:hypothetical protein
MYRRKLHRQFPIFFAYILFQVVGFAILFPFYLSSSSADYCFAYWISALRAGFSDLSSSMRFSRMGVGFFLP